SPGSEADERSEPLQRCGGRIERALRPRAALERATELTESLAVVARGRIPLRRAGTRRCCTREVARVLLQCLDHLDGVLAARVRDDPKPRRGVVQPRLDLSGERGNIR